MTLDGNSSAVSTMLVFYVLFFLYDLRIQPPVSSISMSFSMLIASRTVLSAFVWVYNSQDLLLRNNFMLLFCFCTLLGQLISVAHFWCQHCHLLKAFGFGLVLCTLGAVCSSCMLPLSVFMLCFG